MKAVGARISGGVTVGSKVKCDDNSGAKLLRIIAKLKYRGRRRRIPSIGVSELFVASVIEGKAEMKKKIVRAVLIRQRKPYRRKTGEIISFEDNAAALITEKNEPVGTEIKGVVAKEVGERFPKVSTISRNLI